MAKLVKSIYTASDVTALGELTSSDSVDHDVDFDSTITASRGIGDTNVNTTTTGSVTLDFSSYQNFVLTLTGNVTLDNPTTESVGQSGFPVTIKHNVWNNICSTCC